MRWLLLFTLIAVAYSLAFPDLDLRISHLFYRKETGFFLEWHPLARGFYLAVRYFSWAGLCLLLALMLKRCITGSGLSWQHAAYLLIIILLGPCLMIEGITKESMQRPRPRDITEFGGSKAYAPPFTRGQEEGKSFVSNHAAVGFYLCAFAFFYQGRRRHLWYGAGLFLGSAIGLLRIIQGGHFFSDILFSGIIMLWIIHLCAWKMLRNNNTALKESV